MAEIDEKKIYSEYVERMKGLTASGEEEIVLDALSHGRNTYLRMDRVESSDFDLSWIGKIEDVLYDLGEIIKAPRITTKQVADLAPVELARKVTGESIQHLASHTQYVKEIDDYGNVIPSKVLNIANEDEIFTYENRFIATFIRKLVLFIEKRYEFAKNFASLHDEEVLYLKNKTHMGKTDIEIETKVHVSTETESLMAQKHNEAFARIEEIRRYVTYYYASPFMKAFKTDHNVRNPIVKTNILRKNVKYKHCYDVYRYIESYTRLGVRFRVDEHYSDFSEREMKQLNYALFASYLAVQGQKKSVKGKTFSREYKPHILHSMDDESFVYGPYLKGPVSFVRIDEGYRQYLESLRYKDLPERPSQAEREYYAQELQHAKDLKNFDREVAALLHRKEKEAERFEKKAQQIIEERELARIKLQEAQEKIAAQQEEDMLNRIRAEIVRSARESFNFNYEGFDQAGNKPDVPEQDERPNEVRPSFVPNQSHFNLDSVETDPNAIPAPSEPLPPLVEEQAPVEEEILQVPQEERLSIEGYERLSFAAKLNKADDHLKDAYRAIKKEALSFGLRSRVSQSCDTYKLTGELRGVYLKLTIVGKTLKAYYKLDPFAYEGTTIPHENASRVKAYAEVPMLFRVRSDLSVRRAVQLVDDMMLALGLTQREVSEDELALPKEEEAKGENRIAPKPLDLPEAVDLPERAPKPELAPEEAPVIETAPEPAPIVEPAPVVVPTVEGATAGGFPEVDRLPFLAKIARAEESLKEAYMEVRKAALSYGLHSRFSNACDTYKLTGELRGVYLKLAIVGKTLKAYYKLDPKVYDGTTIPHEDASDMKAYAEVPMLFRVRSGLSVRRAVALVDDMMRPLGLEPGEVSEEELAIPEPEEKEAVVRKADFSKIASTPASEPTVELEPEPVIEPEPVAEPEPIIVSEPSEAVGEAKEGKANDFSSLAGIERVPFDQKYEMADQSIKDAYTQIKNAALSYGLHSRISNFGDTFKLNGPNRGVYLKLTIVGKTLRAYYKLNPKDYEGTTLPFEDVSDKKSYAETPLLLRVRSGLSLRRAMKLLDEMFNPDQRTEEE